MELAFCSAVFVILFGVMFQMKSSDNVCPLKGVSADTIVNLK